MRKTELNLKFYLSFFPWVHLAPCQYSFRWNILWALNVLTPMHEMKTGNFMCFATWHTVYPKKYAHSFCFAVLCSGYTLTDFPISIRLTSLALWQSNDCPSASKATLMNMDKYFMWILYERLHNHNKAKHNKTVCIFLGIYCKMPLVFSFNQLSSSQEWYHEQSVQSLQ